MCMTKTQTQILELFEKLDMRERQEIAEQLYAAAGMPSFYEQMSQEQRAELMESIAEADRGEVEDASDVFQQLRQKNGLVS